MTDEFLEWTAEAVKDKTCAVPMCDKVPAYERNGRKLCGWHAEERDQL